MEIFKEVMELEEAGGPAMDGRQRRRYSELAAMLDHELDLRLCDTGPLDIQSEDPPDNDSEDWWRAFDLRRQLEVLAGQRR